MSKYVKWHLVDSVTQAYTNNIMTPNGLTHPTIIGLDCKVSFGPTYYGTCDTNSTIPEVSAAACEFISLETLNSELEDVFNAKKLSVKQLIWSKAKDKRQLVAGSYHPAEISAGVVKQQQAVDAIAAINETGAGLIAPLLKIEADVRGISVKELAAKVISAYNNFLAVEASIAGYCGKMVDQFNNVIYEPEKLFDNFEKFNIDWDAGWPV